MQTSHVRRPIRVSHGVAAVIAMTMIAGAHAGTIRHDRDDADYLALAQESQFRSVGDLLVNFGDGTGARCSATLINSQWVLTAAHCIDGDLDPSQVSFTVGGSTYEATELHVHESWNGNLANGFDIALFRIDERVTNVQVAQLYDGNAETGQIGTSVGFGTTGTGLTGWQGGTSGTKRAGNNVIDFTGDAIGWSSDIILSDFDNPDDPSSNSSGSPEALDLEYNTAPGDSGGSTWVFEDGVWQVVGVHSLIASNDGFTDADYGDFAGHTRVAAYLDWINNIVPSPSTVPIFAIGSLAILRRRR